MTGGGTKQPGSPATHEAVHPHELTHVQDEQEVLHGLVHHVVTSVPGCDVAGVSWVTDRRHRKVETPAATDDLALQADLLQYELGEGPCLAAVWDQERTYAVPEVATDPRWPAWGPRAHELGIGSSLSLRLGSDREVLGSLNLYSRRAQAFPQDDLNIADVCATYASIALRAVRDLHHVEAAMHSRHVIGLAQGILMERQRLTQDEAFACLVAYSQQTNTKLREVAASLVQCGALS